MLNRNICSLLPRAFCGEGCLRLMSRGVHPISWTFQSTCFIFVYMIVVVNTSELGPCSRLRHAIEAFHNWFASYTVESNSSASPLQPAWGVNGNFLAYEQCQRPTKAWPLPSIYGIHTIWHLRRNKGLHHVVGSMCSNRL